jgi:hypothetical protein
MLKAGGQGMDLQSLHYRRSVPSPSDDFCDPHRWHQILLHRGQNGICADLHFRIAGMIVTAGESQAGDGDEDSGKTR